MEKRLQDTDIEYAAFTENSGKTILTSSLTYCKSLSYEFENLYNLLTYIKLIRKTDS